MKNLALTLIIGLLLSISSSVEGQMSNREIRKTLKLKPPREVKKQAKVYKKQGYTVAVGAPSIERQLTNGWLKEIEEDKSGYKKYFVASNSSVGETQIAAKLQATEAAKLTLAGDISTSVAALVENNFANSQLNSEEATSVTQTIAASKSIIAQELGRIITLVELYRNIDKNIEANIRIAYNAEMAMELAKKVIRKSLQEKTDLLQNKLDKLMDF
jgi:hypothetical protein